MYIVLNIMFDISNKKLDYVIDQYVQDALCMIKYTDVNTHVYSIIMMLINSKRCILIVMYISMNMVFTAYSIHNKLYSIHYTAYSIHYTVYSIHYPLYSLQYTRFRIHAIFRLDNVSR